MKEDHRTLDILNPELRGMPQRDYHEELNIRAHNAGYCQRDGSPNPFKIMDRGFGNSHVVKVWPRDPKTGELIDD